MSNVVNIRHIIKKEEQTENLLYFCYNFLTENAFILEQVHIIQYIHYLAYGFGRCVQ